MDATNVLNDLWIYFLGCPDCWAAVLAIVFLLFLWAMYRKSQRTIEVYRSGLGKVRVSVSALTHLVKEACGRVGVLHCSDVHFKENKGKFDLDLKVRIGLDQNVADLMRNLNHLLHVALGRILGPDYVGKISLNIVGFKGDINQIQIPTGYDLENKAEEFKFLAKKEEAEADKS